MSSTSWSYKDFSPANLTAEWFIGNHFQVVKDFYGEKGKSSSLDSIDSCSFFRKIANCGLYACSSIELFNKLRSFERKLRQANDSVLEQCTNSNI